MNQSESAKILFEKYPDIEKAYKLYQNLSWIFNNSKNKTSALVILAKWDEKVRQAALKASLQLQEQYQYTTRIS